LAQIVLSGLEDGEGIGTGDSYAPLRYHGAGLNLTCRPNLLIVAKSKKTRLKPLTDEQKQDLRDNWLAPTGSVQERQFLKKWSEQKGLDEADRALIREWHKMPDGFAKRNVGFSRIAKQAVLGDVIYEIALERHKKLPRGREWEVACLTTEGYGQEEIAELMNKSPRTIDGIILKIKQIIVQDLNCEMESVNIAQISLWFRGL
jgi:ATP/maltotriose-dependent transcriptional regulator MalT